MMNEIDRTKCKRCGRPAMESKYKWEPPRCFVCQLVNRHAKSPPRNSPGNIADWEIEIWMEKSLRAAFEEMLSMMRADLETLSLKWNPPEVHTEDRVHEEQAHASVAGALS
jgi:hypothetical protein